MSHHPHSHDNPHSHGPIDYNRAFALGVGLNLVYVLVEATFGFWAGSLALLSDAGHNLSDVLGLLLAWGAHYLSHWPSTERRTYGWRSSSILAAALNGLVLVAAIGAIAWEAIRRFGQPVETPGRVIMAVALVGVIINTATALLFMRGRKGDLNLRGAYLHMAADAGVSAGVVAAGVAIQITGWRWIDPAMSLVVALIILASAWGLLRDSVNLLLHAAPAEIEPGHVRAWLAGLPGVVEVHDLHIWAMSTTSVALTAHLVRPDLQNDDDFLSHAAHELHERFGIEHATLQIERSVVRCRHAGSSQCAAAHSCH